jgi:hypothetical protein
MNHVFFMKYTVLLYLYVFLLCFNFRNIFFLYISHVLTKIHMYNILDIKYTVLLVFFCVFTMFSLQKHVFLVNFTCIQKFTFTIYYMVYVHVYEYMVHVYFNIHEKCTRSICFCSENTLKHNKILAKLFISCRIHNSCVFIYIYV